MGKPLKILTVDDEYGVANALAFTLSNPARQLTPVFTADEALKKVTDHSQSFDVVIIDHKMPSVSGTQLVRALRALNFRGKIVILSAYLTDETRQAYAELNVDRILTKPFDVEELREVIDKVAKVA
jgi:DNA-binding response OmpR family regulator